MKAAASADIRELLQRLQLQEKQLSALLQITQAINNNVSARGLLKTYETLLLRNLPIRKMALFIQHTGWMCSNAAGISRPEADALCMPHLSTFRQVTLLNRIGHELAAVFDVVVPVFHKELPLAFTFVQLTDGSAEPPDEEITFIQTLSSIVAVAIENKKLFRAQMKHRFFKAELELAGQMQTMLIPGKLPDDHRVSAAGIYLPHQEVGGDYYDFIELNEDEFFFCMGDISGKGVVAALLMANFQASVRIFAEHERSLQRLTELLNARVNEITKGEKFITLFLARFQRDKRELHYVNAGHNPPILVHDGTSRLLSEGCTILGMFERLPYVHVQRLTLPNEFMVFCYTDGLVDTENEQQESFDVSQLLAFTEKNHHLKPAAFNKKLVDTLIQFKKQRTTADDISLLTCRFY
ncbi:MAG: PP2C family protein-serine/threonine phosphatase [Chitinophagales bacterium]|nr:serine/threonine-protein phosphatase [Chitinophagales bacterium]MDW8393617.1 PP2C family protein-serine/threonine phosphatase [Chitinophagales bacterium]